MQKCNCSQGVKHFVLFDPFMKDLKDLPSWKTDLKAQSPKVIKNNKSMRGGHGTKGEEKRQVPPMLQKLLRVDVQVTRKFLEVALRTTALKSLKNHAKLLEWSCHGVVWLAAWLSFIWFANYPSLYQLQVNTLIALILDIIVIAVTKAIIRRRRPAAVGKLVALGPDKYSFPSGHVSRAVLLSYIFIYLDPVSIVFAPPLLAWTVAVGLSRVLLERHYLLDVAGGIGIGLLEGVLVGLMWFSQTTSASFLSMLSDEKRDGGEYHV